MENFFAIEVARLKIRKEKPLKKLSENEEAARLKAARKQSLLERLAENEARSEEMGKEAKEFEEKVSLKYIPLTY